MRTEARHSADSIINLLSNADIEVAYRGLLKSMYQLKVDYENQLVATESQIQFVEGLILSEELTPDCLPIIWVSFRSLWNRICNNRFRANTSAYDIAASNMVARFVFIDRCKRKVCFSN